MIKRENRRFSLTEAGEFFYRKAKKLIHNTDRIVARPELKEYLGSCERDLKVLNFKQLDYFLLNFGNIIISKKCIQ